MNEIEIKLKYCQDIGEYYGEYEEKEGILNIDNGETVFSYSSPDELLTDWVETLIETEASLPKRERGYWREVIEYVYTTVLRRAPRNVYAQTGGKKYRVICNYTSKSRPRIKGVYIDACDTLFDGIMAYKDFMCAWHNTGVNYKTEEGYERLIKFAEEYRIKHKNVCAAVCTDSVNRQTFVEIYPTSCPKDKYLDLVSGSNAKRNYVCFFTETNEAIAWAKELAERNSWNYSAGRTREYD